MKKILVIVFSVISIYSFSQEDSLVFVKWKSFEEVGELFAERQAPILIWLYTDDCDSCQIMLDSTLNRNEVANYINILFYPIKLNAKSNDTITFFNGEKYSRQQNRQCLDLAYTLLADSIVFPTLVLFDEQAQGRSFYGYKRLRKKRSY